MKKFTILICIAIQRFLSPAFILILSFISLSLNAQNACQNDTTLFLENFGTGSVSTSHPDIIATALTYQDSGSLSAIGVYRVINNTHQKPEWLASPDHTANMNGRMLVVNGKGGTFYRHDLNKNAGFPAGFYSASLYIMNVNKLPTCGPNALLTSITLSVEYQAQDNSWVSFTGSPVTLWSVPQTVIPVWVFSGGIFVLPATGNFIVQNIRLTLRDELSGGCGSDYALDDIKFSACPGNGPLPVQFLSLSARQKGSGVTINWSTASETNNKYFDVEKSIDGTLNWTLVSTMQTNGSSNYTKNYSAYDAKPFAGINYYRIKQVDIDGRYKYSATVNVKLVIDRTSVTVLTNPFINELLIDFLSKSSQTVSVSLFDITGRQVADERFVIPKGDSRQSFTKAGNLQKGMYIMNIRDKNGTLIYNGKLIRQ